MLVTFDLKSGKWEEDAYAIETAEFIAPIQRPKSPPLLIWPIQAMERETKLPVPNP
jgi:hypothetical protein